MRIWGSISLVFFRADVVQMPTEKVPAITSQGTIVGLVIPRLVYKLPIRVSVLMNIQAGPALANMHRLRELGEAYRRLSAFMRFFI